MSSATTYIGVPSTPLEPTTSITIEQALRLFAKGLRVCAPARVLAVNGANRVDVQPGFQARFATQPAGIDLPPISQVPVVQPQGVNYSIQLPVAVGDTGMLIFADRCIDTWLAGDGNPRDPNDPRLHDLADAIFVPGLLTSDIAANQTPYGSDVVIRNGTAKLHVQKAGTYKIENSAAELVALVHDLASAVADLSTATAAAVVDPMTFKLNEASSAKIAQAGTQAKAAATKIATLVGS